MLTFVLYILKYFIFNLNAFLLYAVIKDRCAPEILGYTTIHGNLGAFLPEDARGCWGFAETIRLKLAPS